MNDDLSHLKDDGWVPSTDRNLVAERRARLEKAASGQARRIRGRKTGDPRLDRARADHRAQQAQNDADRRTARADG